MAAIAKKRQWILGGALALTLGAVAWISQSDNSDAEANIPSEPRIPEHHNSVVATEERTSHPAPQLRYSDSVQDIFATPVTEQPLTKMPPEIITPTAPPLPFTYMGRAVESGIEMIFLASAQRNYMVHSGDVIESNYRIDSISNGLVRFTYLPLAITQTLAIGESE